MTVIRFSCASRFCLLIAMAGFPALGSDAEDRLAAILETGRRYGISGEEIARIMREEMK